MKPRKPMVKTRTLFGVLLPLALAAAVGGCSSGGRLVGLKPESLQLSSGPAAPSLSLRVDSGSLYAVFADPATTGLDMATIPIGPRLPDAAPAPQLIDKVDVAPPLSPFFGEHVFATGGGKMAVLYLGRETDAKNVLKLASRAPDAPQWDLDVLEPAGDPLSLDPDGKGGFAAAWSSGLLSYRGADGQVASAFPPLPLRLEGRSGPDGSGGFSAYDGLASVLLWLQWNGAGFTALPVPEGSPVSASLRSPSGLLSVVSYSPKARRLLLHQESEPSKTFSTVTVTVCDGTTGVALLPGASDSSFLFVFDETRTVGAGRTVYQLSLIAPGSLLGAHGARYRKAALAEGDLRIDGFAAARTADALYVLVSQGNLRLLRIALAP
jgi:hypothetical protein